MAKLIKIQAAGNRFLIADQRWFAGEPSFLNPDQWVDINSSFEDFLNLAEKNQEERSAFLKSILSLEGADLTEGLIILKDHQAKTLEYDFYNRDGSMPEMCGNAACSILFYAEKTNLPLDAFLFANEKITITKNSQNQPAICLTKDVQNKGSFQFEFQNETYDYTLIEAGVPHAVLEWSKDFDPKEFKDLARTLRFKNPLNDKGMNVSFYQETDSNLIKAITFERGVDDFTLACGTGALSMAYHFLKKGHENLYDHVFVEMPGGRLTVQYRPQISLHSPARWGFQ